MGKLDIRSYIVSLSRLGVTDRPQRPESRSSSACHTGVAGIPSFYRCVHTPLAALCPCGSPSPHHHFSPLHCLLNSLSRSSRHSHSYAYFSGPPLLYYICPHGSHLPCKSPDNSSGYPAT